MPKYIPIITIFFVTLIIIFFYVFRNSEITKSISQFLEVENLTYELKALTHKQQKYFQVFEQENNYDEAVRINKDFNYRFEYFQTLIYKVGDVKLENLLYDMNQKRFVLSHIYEDIKTDHAVIKNSQKWLAKSYRNYLEKTPTTQLDRNVLLYIFNGVIPFKDEREGGKFEEIKSSFLDKDIFNAHLRMIYEKRESLASLQTSLERYSLLDEFDRVILHSLKKLHRLQQETEEIIMILLITSSFLLLFGLIVYIKEVVNAKETKRLKNELQQFVDALNKSAIVSKTDLSGKITYVNDKFCEVSGYKEEELIGRAHSIVRHPNMNKGIFAELWNTIENKKIFTGMIQNSTKNGESYFVDTVIVPLLDIEGEITEYLGVRYEVTDLVQSRNNAQKAEKAKDEFLLNMSHELRAPLSAIDGFTAILQRLLKEEQHLKYVTYIMDSSENLTELINSILDLSKLQSGKFIIDEHDFNVEEKLLVLAEHFDILLAKSGLSLTRYFDSSIDVILHGDWLRISQVLTNLMSHAMKFSIETNRIELSAFYEHGTLTLEVRDFGIGLSEEAQAKISQPLEQVDNSIIWKYGETGLGLSIVLKLVEQMRGTITLEDTKGNGTCFKVTLPLKQA